jgi:hypothetical protein
LQTDDVIVISAHTILEKQFAMKIDVEFVPGRDGDEMQESTSYLTAFTERD